MLNLNRGPKIFLKLRNMKKWMNPTHLEDPVCKQLVLSSVSLDMDHRREEKAYEVFCLPEL